jgi:hypothetical protein
MEEFGPGGAWNGSAMTDRVRRAILAIEAEARATPPSLDVERLGPNDEWPAGISDGLSLSCSDCGEVPLCFDYHVTEEFWRQWGDGPNVVCLPCLDLRCGGAGLAEAVEQITWTGTGHSIVTEPSRRIDYSAWRDVTSKEERP